MPKKSEKWVACDEKELHDKNLSCTDLRVLLHIKYKAGYLETKGKKYFASYKTISEATGVSERSISTSIKNLVALGYLSTERRGMSTYEYTVW